MIKTTIKIDGMMCGMCEAHISGTIRKNFPGAKKVSASHGKGIATFLSDEVPDEAVLKKAINDTGYQYISSESNEYVKKGLFGLE
ncbi:MAG: cation transporter [Lachnospiraceae bacterium]|nr:cation transporter [Lachnospiraceae bacterium]